MEDDDDDYPIVGWLESQGNFTVVEARQISDAIGLEKIDGLLLIAPDNKGLSTLKASLRDRFIAYLRKNIWSHPASIANQGPVGTLEQTNLSQSQQKVYDLLISHGVKRNPALKLIVQHEVNTVADLKQLTDIKIDEIFRWDVTRDYIKRARDAATANPYSVRVSCSF